MNTRDDSAVLYTVEQRIRSLINIRMGAITTHITAHLGVIIRGSSTLTGSELLSRPEAHAAVSLALAVAHEHAESITRAGFRAAGKLGRRTAAAEQAQREHTPEESDDSPYLDAVFVGLALAFAAALTDIQNSVRAAYDGVTGPARTAAQLLVVHEAVHRAVRRLAVRVTAAAVSAVHRGYTDAQQDYYTSLHNTHTYLVFTKRWQTRSANPCPACRALHGTQVGLGEEFDRTATTPGTKPLPVFRDLLGPPRHPNCRCRLVFEVNPAGAAIRRRVEASPPGPTPQRLSAAEVRRMPAGQYAAFIAFLTAATRRLKTLLGKARAGG